MKEISLDDKDSSLADDQKQRITEHEANIAAAQRALEKVRGELASESDRDQRKALEFQRLHLEQDIHDSRDLIQSIRSGTLVKTRGPWDEHASATAANSTLKLVEDCRRARDMQANFIRMISILQKHKPEEANKLFDSLRQKMTQGIYQPGGFKDAQEALNNVHLNALNAVKETQAKDYADVESSQAKLVVIDNHLAALESLKKNCGRLIFVGSLGASMGTGLAFSMIYEGAVTATEKGPEAAIKNMAVQGGIMVGCMGVMKVGGWAIGKLLNPKVVNSEVNTFKSIVESNRYTQEMEWNQALVNKLKEKSRAFEQSKASGGQGYLKARMDLDDAVSAVNSSSLAKNIMKNEMVAAESAIAKGGGKKVVEKFIETNSYQKVYNQRLQSYIYPRTDARMVKSMQNKGYNVESSWFREFRNASSKGINRDRDIGLLAEFEGKIMKNGKPVSRTQFMQECQKEYNIAYKEVTGRSAGLADQSITTTAFNEAFPLKWLEKNLGSAVADPNDYQKAGTAIYCDLSQ